MRQRRSGYQSDFQGDTAAKAFAGRSKNLVITARLGNNLEKLKRETLEKHPELDIVIRCTDLSIYPDVVVTLLFPRQYCATTKTEFGMVENKKAGIVIVASDIF